MHRSAAGRGLPVSSGPSPASGATAVYRRHYCCCCCCDRTTRQSRRSCRRGRRRRPSRSGSRRSGSSGCRTKAACCAGPRSPRRNSTPSCTSHGSRRTSGPRRSYTKTSRHRYRTATARPRHRSWNRTLDTACSSGCTRTW